MCILSGMHPAIIGLHRVDGAFYMMHPTLLGTNHVIYNVAREKERGGGRGRKEKDRGRRKKKGRECERKRERDKVGGLRGGSVAKMVHT